MTSPDIDKNIFRAAENVNLDKLVSWTENGKIINRYERED